MTAVLGALVALAVGMYQAHVGATRVTSAEIQCGEIIAAIYGQLRPEGE